MKLFIIILFTILNFNLCKNPNTKEPPKAIKGVLDLRNWDFDPSTGSGDGVVNLDGEWEFYWKEFLPPSINEGEKMFSNLQRPEISYIKVPGNWNDFVVDGKPAGGKGYATYRLILKLPPEIKNKEGFKLGFKLLNPFTSYKFFVNGALFTEIGKVAKTEINSIPFFKPQVISIPLYNQDIEILIHVSNFHYNKAGLIEIIKVGDLIVLQEEREKNLRFDFLLFGSLLLMGIYHLGLFALRQKESYNLYFGLFSILMAIRPFYTGEMYLYSSLPWYLSLKIEYLTFYLGTPIFFLFVFSIFPLDSPKWSKYGIVVLSGLLSLLVIILPVYYFTQTLLPMQLVTLFGIIITFYVMLLAILRKREGGKSFLIGFIVFSLIIANDILNNMSVIHTGYYGPVGFLLFVFSQAFFLSTRSAKAFNLVEEFAETLDAKISDAVEEQKKYSKCILDLNKSNTNAELGLEKALQEVTETCTKTLNVTRTSVWLLDKDSKNLNCVNRFDIISKSHTKGETYHISDYPIYFDYFHSGEILSASNVFEHPAEIEFNENYHSPNNIKSIMEMPIISSGKLLGIVTCEQTYNYRNWSEEEQSFLSSIAGILVGYFEYNERQEAFSQLTETKREVEDLNKFTTIINSLSNLDAIFTEISKHIYNRFGIKGTWLFLSDKNKEYMYAYKAYSYDHVPEEIYNYLKNSKAPLNESGGTIYLVFKRGKPLYFSKIPKFEFEFDKVMVDILKVKSFLYVPLQIKKETIGIMAFANLGEELKLKRKEVNLINNLCNQISGVVETAHLLDQVNKTKKETDVLNEISKAANSNLEINKIIDNTMDFIKEQFEIDLCSFVIPNLKNNTLETIYFSEHPEVNMQKIKGKFDMNQLDLLDMNHVHGYVYQTKKTLYTKILLEPNNSYEKDFIEICKLKSFICIPLLIKNETIGLLSFTRYNEVMNLSENEILFLEKIAEVLAGAINNSNLLKVTEQQKKETEALNELTKKLNETNDIDLIMNFILEYVNERFYFPYYSLFVLDRDSNSLVFKSATYPDYVTFKQKKTFRKQRFYFNSENPESLHNKSINNKSPVYIKDIKQEGKSETAKTLIEIVKHKSVIILPLLLQNKPIGSLDFYSTELVDLSSEDIKKLNSLAEHLSGILNGIFLYSEVQEEKENALLLKIEADAKKEEAEISKREIEELNKLIKSLNEELDLKVILKKVHNYVKEKFGIQFYGLYQLNSNKSHIKIIDATFPDYVEQKDLDKIYNFEIPINLNFGVHTTILKFKRPIFLPKIRKKNLTEEELFIIEKTKMNSFFMIPLILNNEPIGILDFSNYHKEMNITKEDITRISILGEQLAGIVHSSNLLQQIQEEKDNVDVAMKEIEKLNEFSKKVNSISNLDLILEEIFKFIVENYKIDFGFIQLKEDTFLKTKKVGNYSNILSEEQLNYVENLKIPLNESGGVSFKTYKRKKPTFMPLSLMNQLFTKDYPGFELDKMLIEQMHLTSFLIIPLIIQNEVIGLAFFTSHLSDLKFTKKEISRIEGFCNQIVGAIYNGNLLSETNKAKSEIEFLNEFSRTINASNKLEEIFTTAILELNQRLGVDFFILELIDEKKNELFTRCFSGQVSPEYFQFINETKIPLVKESGSIFLPFDKRKSIYLKSINIISSNKLSKYDRIMRDELGFNSFFHLPLMVNDKVIGIFQINKIGGMKRLSKDEIKFAESLCDQLANAVNNSYLIEKTEKQKKESEQLNKLMKNINSVSSLSDIMMFFMLYLEKNLGFKDFALITHEESENSLNVHSFVSPKITNDNKFYLHSLKMDISSLTGIFAELYKYKKLIFINKENIPEEDFYANEFIERGSLDYLLLTPMIIYGELVGILLVHAPIDKLEVTESITEKVNRFSDMVAGSVFNAKLLKKVEETGEIAETERQKSEKLLLNILPKDVATELKEKGFSEPVLFDSVSVMFTDFKGFTQIAETLTPQELVKDLDACFVQFDKISERYNLEKLKTIGDSYMCAGGIPRKNVTHAIDSVLAAMEIQDFMNMMKDLKEKKGFPYWEIRLGIHTGPLVAGVIGEKKFAYDVWGDTVNTASRMESSGTPGKINISGTTYDLVKDLFECEYRGKVNAKNKGEVDMYYVYGLKEEYSKEGDRKTPNGKFWELYSKNE